ncbi:MAG TPA: pilus assembly protein PilP [Burkholderiales bacterium]
MRQLSILLVALVLFGCGGGEQRQLQSELDGLSKDLRGKVQPLPVVKPYEPASYAAFELPDPFGPAKIALATNTKSATSSGIQPDLNRPREPLESYSIETLRMVGVLRQHKRTFALVKADTGLYRVSPGNYMGQNFGLITAINETEITLKELVQDAAGDWTERESSLQLQEAKGSNK